MEDILHAARNAIKGDEEALIRFMEMTEARLYRTAHRLAGSEADAEEILQDAYVAFYKKGPSFSSEGALWGWLYKTVIHKSIDIIRSRNPHISLEDIPETAAGSNMPDEQNIEAILKNAVMSMSYMQRAVFLLRDVEDISYEDISAMLGIAASTARNHYHIAKERIKQVILKN